MRSLLRVRVSKLTLGKPKRWSVVILQKMTSLKTRLTHVGTAL